MASVESVSGRYAVVRVGELTIRLLLAKNPAGWSELVDIMPPAPTPPTAATPRGSGTCRSSGCAVGS